MVGTSNKWVPVAWPLRLDIEPLEVHLHEIIQHRSLANGIEAACGGAAWEWTAILKSRNGVKKPGDLGYKW